MSAPCSTRPKVNRCDRGIEVLVLLDFEMLNENKYGKGLVTEKQNL